MNEKPDTCNCRYILYSQIPTHLDKLITWNIWGWRIAFRFKGDYVK